MAQPLVYYNNYLPLQHKRYDNISYHLGACNVCTVEKMKADPGLYCDLKDSFQAGKYCKMMCPTNFNQGCTGMHREKTIKFFAQIFIQSHHKYFEYFQTFGNYMSTYLRHFCILKIHLRGYLLLVVGYNKKALPICIAGKMKRLIMIYALSVCKVNTI